jgi:hypothetical protein
MAQPKVTFIAPDPSFLPHGLFIEPLSEARAVPTNATALEHLAPYTVLLTNRSSEDIIVITMKYEMVDPSGRTAAQRLILQNPHTDRKGIRVKPGDSRVITPSGPVNRAIAAGSVVPSNELPALQFGSPSEVRVSVDSVLFASGRFIGEDSFHTFGLLESKFRSERAFYGEFLDAAGTGSDMKAWLGKQANVQLAGNTLDPRFDHDSHFRKLLAGSFSQILALRGLSATIDQAKFELQRAPALVPYRP